MWTYNNTNELYHYGVSGMKWGKRKKQSFAPDMSNKPRRGVLIDGPMNRDEHRRSMEQKDKQISDGIKKVIQKTKKPELSTKQKIDKGASIATAILKARGHTNIKWLN